MGFDPCNVGSILQPQPSSLRNKFAVSLKYSSNFEIYKKFLNKGRALVKINEILSQVGL